MNVVDPLHTPSWRNGGFNQWILKSDLHSLPLAYPPKRLLEKYDQVVSAYNQIIFSKSMESIQLAKLRDWLLPLLMNGQATVVDDESKKLAFPAISQARAKHDPRLERWLVSQALAARGSIDEATLKDIFDSMDDDDK